MLLVVVYGAFLLLVGVTASALVAITSAHLRTADAQRGHQPRRLAGGAVREWHAPARRRRRERADRRPRGDPPASVGGACRTTDPGGWSSAASTGRSLPATVRRGRGQRPAASAVAKDAAAGIPSVALADDAAPAGVSGGGKALEEYLPILNGERRPLAVMAIWRDAAPLLATLEATQRDVMLIILAAAVLLAILLFGVFRAAQARLTRQQRQLVEATAGSDDRNAQPRRRRRPAGGPRRGCPGERCHDRRGACRHRQLPALQRRPRPSGCRRGPAAGRRSGPARRRWGTAGRSGALRSRRVPRRAPAASAADMETLVAGLRSELGDVAFQFGESERLPSA